MLSAALLAICAIALMVMKHQIDVPVLVPIVLILHSAEEIWNTLGTLRIRAKKAGRFEELL